MSGSGALLAAILSGSRLAPATTVRGVTSHAAGSDFRNTGSVGQAGSYAGFFVGWWFMLTTQVVGAANRYFIQAGSNTVVNGYGGRVTGAHAALSGLFSNGAGATISTPSAAVAGGDLNKIQLAIAWIDGVPGNVRARIATTLGGAGVVEASAGNAIPGYTPAVGGVRLTQSTAGANVLDPSTKLYGAFVGTLATIPPGASAGDIARAAAERMAAFRNLAAALRIAGRTPERTSDPGVVITDTWDIARDYNPGLPTTVPATLTDVPGSTTLTKNGAALTLVSEAPVWGWPADAKEA
jgi:hypothetical protein